MRPMLRSACLVLLVCAACSETGNTPPAPPLAPPVSYDWIGNADLVASSAQGIVARAGGTAFAVVPAVNQATTGGGQVNVESNGAFHYTPSHLSFGTDTFTYTRASDLAVGTVTISRATRVWFVDGDAPISGDGTLLEPFDTLAAAAAASLANDTIFVFQSVTALPDGLVMKPGQQLIGELMGLVRDNIEIVAPGTMPAIEANTTPGATLAPGARIAGLQFVALAADALVVDLGASSSVTFDTLNVLGTGLVGRGLVVDVGAGEALNLNANNFDCSGTARGLAASIAGDLTLNFEQCSFGANTLGEMQVACTGTGTTNLLFNNVTFMFDFGSGVELSAADDANLNMSCATASAGTLVGAAPMWFQTSATDTASLSLALLDMVGTAGKSTPVAEVVHVESSGNAMTQVLLSGSDFNLQDAMVLNVNNTASSQFSFLVMESSFMRVASVLSAMSSGLSCTGTIFDCTISNAYSLVNLTNNAGQLICNFDQVNATGTNLSGVSINALGTLSSMVFNACSITNGNGGALALVDSTSVSSYLLVQNCNITNNGPLGLSVLHNGSGTSCVDIHGTTFGRTNGLPSHIMLSNPGASGPLQLAPALPPNTALPGSMQLLFGAITSVLGCGN